VEVLYHCEFLREPEQYKSKWNIIRENVLPHLYSDFSFGNSFCNYFLKYLDMGIVKLCHPGNLVSMPLFGRYYRKKSVTLDCGLLVLFPLHRLILVPSIGGEWCLLLHQPIPPFGMICFGLGNQ